MVINILENWSLKKIIGTKYFVVSSYYEFELKMYWKTYQIIVPEWFITDLGSIPPIFFFFDKARYVSYIMHDFLYNHIWKIIDKETWEELNYNQMDSDDYLCVWLKKEWMWWFWIWQVSVWLLIWGRFNFKTKKKKILKLIEERPNLRNLSFKKINYV